MAATAVAGADDQVLVALEHDRQREGAESRFSRLVRGLDRLQPLGDLARHQMGDDLREGDGKVRWIPKPASSSPERLAGLTNMPQL